MLVERVKLVLSQTNLEHSVRILHQYYQPVMPVPNISMQETAFVLPVASDRSLTFKTTDVQPQ